MDWKVSLMDREVNCSLPSRTISGSGTSKTGKGILYVVATPIGNLQDVTLRALEILKQVDLAACEDTRRTTSFLNYYGIKKPVISVFGPKEKGRTSQILRALEQGRSVALLSDAGTPSISDPGNFIVRAARESGYKIEPIPGVSALSCALSVCGCSGQGFIFLGFLKRDKGKIKKSLLRIKDSDLPLVFFESPYRIIKTLEIAAEVLGNQTYCWIGREMTKKFEEHIFGSLEEVLGKLRQKEMLGEFTVLLKNAEKTSND